MVATADSSRTYTHNAVNVPLLIGTHLDILLKDAALKCYIVCIVPALPGAIIAMKKRASTSMLRELNTLRFMIMLSGDENDFKQAQGRV
jgi:hypothetical protein